MIIIKLLLLTVANTNYREFLLNYKLTSVTPAQRFASRAKYIITLPVCWHCLCSSRSTLLYSSKMIRSREETQYKAILWTTLSSTSRYNRF